MKWLFLFVGIVVVCFVVALVLGLAGGGLGRTSASLSHEPLPDEPIRDADFDDLVFDVGARGYRMSQVDGVIDRLRRELREKDEEIAVLRGEDPAVVREPAAGRTVDADERPDRPETGASEVAPTEPVAGERVRSEAGQREGTPSQVEPSEAGQAEDEPSDTTVSRERTT
ncbi:cell division protein DivIVA [Terrabacter sp. GCM10028922]|uniref:cell division protein DivIVA n=1 Tax=Terrabacter sp. GCM10028922 TaxID=3273428 RepID=UPI00361B3FCE